MSDAQRKAATHAVAGWIVERLGEGAAHDWMWSCTPIPCGLPSDEQLNEGLLVATGELDLNDLMARVEAEMFEFASVGYKKGSK